MLRHWPKILGRIVLVWAIKVPALMLMAWLLPGIDVSGWESAAVAVIAIAAVNTILWPIIAWVTMPITILTLGIGSVVLNGLMVWLAGYFVPGFEVSGWFSPIAAAFGITFITTVLASIFAFGDYDVAYRNVHLRLQRRGRVSGAEANVPGLIFLEIDGLSERVLRQALADGRMPTLKSWIDSGSHRLQGWECDWSSQTSVSQAGLLHGNNENMPAFRWYEKDSKRVMVSNHGRDAGEIEKRISNGDGLLSDRGAARGNMFTGDAESMSLIFSRASVSTRRGQALYAFFVNPYALPRTLTLFAWEVLVEKYWAWRQHLSNELPRIDRGGVYPILRGVTTIILRDFVAYLVIGDIFSGVRALYATFVGYDEVAHHSGVERPDAMEILNDLDGWFAKIAATARMAPRPYKIVVLSDHGQSQGATFKQRYRGSLHELVQGLVSEAASVNAPVGAGEDWGNINAFLTSALSDDSTVAETMKRVIHRRTKDGEVMLGPERHRAAAVAGKDIVVMASGNLGLVYCTEWGHRLTVEEISEHFPKLVPGLAAHPGIGFVMVRSQAHGALAVGADGTNFLEQGRIEGVDPLANFGANAVAHLLRSDGFNNVADIMINSFYDPATGEVAAFEELVGSHGGLGGDQGQPFVLFPSEFDYPAEEVVGAERMNRIFKGWLGDLQPPLR